MHEIESLAFTFEKAFDFQKLSNWLHFYLMMNAENSYRVKGILDCEGHDKKIVLQSVGTEYVMGKGSLWETQNRISKLVFIGKKLDKILLREGLKSCFS